ncbi:hypothetical protein FSP39_010491 [Pinctada imbricata]|uniref:NAD-capped RNA hydrolase NUDT12 n=1 Tax=Pinctada imbricata TaxID=66713 RepID=A0AA89C726_PINIB|nr:hypothetical protein FSP39_010491 [Pinctada imbricata]
MSTSTLGVKENRTPPFPASSTVEVDQRNDKGWTALMFAARNGNVDVINTLLEKGCDVNLVNKTGQTAQDIAFFWDQGNASKVLNDFVNKQNPDKQLRNYFSLNYLDRCSEQRKKEDWLQSKIREECTRFIAFSELKPFVVPLEDRTKRWRYTLAKLKFCDVENYLKSNPPVVFLGVQRNSGPESLDHTMFAVDCTEGNIEDLKKCCPGGTFINPFPSALQLEPSEAGIFAEARSMLDWLYRYKYCGTCGSVTVIAEGGHKRVCEKKDCISNKGIHNTCYPRTDPSVIMLVVSPDGKKCLLGRKKSFPAKMWSCLAGFMEPGESIEDTVRREVEEESGVKVGKVEYHSSQPWPFPASLMLGCVATAVSEDVKVDEDEMEDAQWFRRPELVQMLTHQHPNGYYIPPEQAIAHQIIKSWVRMTANL